MILRSIKGLNEGDTRSLDYSSCVKENAEDSAVEVLEHTKLHPPCWVAVKEHRLSCHNGYLL